MSQYDIVIIGAGIVGLATALKIKETRQDLKVLVLEKEGKVAAHQTGNNSGVIHAGVYYKPGSLKALNCRTGYEKLLAFCDKEEIKYELCGKLIIATEQKEVFSLKNLFERSQQNGLVNVKHIVGQEIKEYEPYANGIEALWVPYTGIINYTDVTNKYAEIFINRFQGELHLNQKVVNILPSEKTTTLVTESGIFEARLIINTAGLFSDKIAKLTHPHLKVRIIPFRGEYSKIKPERSNLIKNLIYPVPDPNFPFLGVHFTRLIDGGIEAGPNAVWAFKREGYKFSDFSFEDFFGALAWPGFQKVMLRYWRMGLGEYYRSFSKPALVKALQRLVPELKSDDLVKGGAGVRAQACDKFGGLIDDFLFLENESVINVLNAPSPAATASLAIGETIADKAIKRFN
jgi:(S)-2-hydroxyglutarate dehydrogenase